MDFFFFALIFVTNTHWFVIPGIFVCMCVYMAGYIHFCYILTKTKSHLLHSYTGKKVAKTIQNDTENNYFSAFELTILHFT